MLDYADFLFETYGKIKADKAKENLLISIGNKMLNESENFFFQHLLSEGYRDKIIEALDTEDYESLYETVNSDNSLHESIITKAKERVQAALAKVKEKGKEALDSMSDGTKALMKMGGNILKPLKLILVKIGEVIKKAWEIGKAKASEAVAKATKKIQERVKSVIKDSDKKKSLMEEMGNMKAMSGAGLKYLTGGFAGDLAKAGEKAATADEGVSYVAYLEGAVIQGAADMIDRGYSLKLIEEELKEYDPADESTLFEGGDGGGLKIPFISSLMKKIGHTQPFKMFHDLGSKAESFANNALEKASYLISKIGGPGPFKFAVLGALIGVAVGYYSELGAKSAVHAAVHAAEHALHFAIPGIGIIFSIIKYTGIALAIYGIVQAIAGQGDKEDTGGDKETSDKETSDKETSDEEPPDKKESK